MDFLGNGRFIWTCIRMGYGNSCRSTGVINSHLKRVFSSLMLFHAPHTLVLGVAQRNDDTKMSRLPAAVLESG